MTYHCHKCSNELEKPRRGYKSLCDSCKKKETEKKRIIRDLLKLNEKYNRFRYSKSTS